MLPPVKFWFFGAVNAKVIVQRVIVTADELHGSPVAAKFVSDVPRRVTRAVSVPPAFKSAICGVNDTTLLFAPVASVTFCAVPTAVLPRKNCTVASIARFELFVTLADIWLPTNAVVADRVTLNEPVRGVIAQFTLRAAPLIMPPAIGVIVITWVPALVNGPAGVMV
jgi:hypothetical protein